MNNEIFYDDIVYVVYIIRFGPFTPQFFIRFMNFEI